MTKYYTKYSSAIAYYGNVLQCASHHHQLA